MFDDQIWWWIFVDINSWLWLDPRSARACWVSEAAPRGARYGRGMLSSLRLPWFEQFETSHMENFRSVCSETFQIFKISLTIFCWTFENDDGTCRSLQQPLVMTEDWAAHVFLSRRTSRFALRRVSQQEMHDGAGVGRLYQSNQSSQSFSSAEVFDQSQTPQIRKVTNLKASHRVSICLYCLWHLDACVKSRYPPIVWKVTTNSRYKDTVRQNRAPDWMKTWPKNGGSYGSIPSPFARQMAWHAHRKTCRIELHASSGGEWEENGMIGMLGMIGMGFLNHQ